MRVVCSSRGSRGDVHPIIEIGGELRGRGCEVRLSVPEHFRDHAGKRCAEPRLYMENSELVMEEMGSGWEQLTNALDWFSRSLDEQFEMMMEETREADILVTSVNELVAPTVAEYRQIPHIRVAYTPVLPGNQPPPLFPLQGTPPFVNRLLWKGLNFGVGLFMRRFVDRIRSDLDLNPMGSVADYFTDTSFTLLALDETLAPACPSWRGRYRFAYSGYCFGKEDGKLDPEVKDFIEKGESPVYVGFGSVTLKEPRLFMDMLAEAASRTGARLIIGRGWTGLGEGYDSENILTVGDHPHYLLFPRMAGAIHHGGCGTTHSVARAGIPQVALPQIADQFYWARRLEDLGCGPSSRTPGRVSVKYLAGVLEDMRGNSGYRESALVVKDALIRDGTPRAADIILSGDQFSDENNRKLKQKERVP